MPAPPAPPPEGSSPPELVEYAARLRRGCLEPLARLYADGDADCRREAVNAFSPQALRRGLLALFDEVEGWYWRRHEEEVGRAARERGLDPTPWLVRPEDRSWVREALRPRLDALLDAAIDAQAGARASLDFARHRLGTNGLGPGLARAASLLLRCWELPGALRQELAALRQASLLDGRLRRDLHGFAEEVDRLCEALEDAVVGRWNARTAPILEQLAGPAPSPPRPR